MNITDDIRKKKLFDDRNPLKPLKPLKPEEMKLFDEYFALAILKYCYPERYKDFTKEEAPDLQRKDKKRGVEVTSAISKGYASIDGNFSNYRLTNDDTRKDILRRRIEKVGGAIDEIVISYPTVTSQHDKEAIKDSIEKKVEKLKSYREKGFEKMELFIYFSDTPGIFDEEKYIDLFKKAEGYETVYFTAPYCLKSYRILEEEFKSVLISTMDYEALKIIARLTVEGEIELDSPIWQ